MRRNFRKYILPFIASLCVLMAAVILESLQPGIVITLIPVLFLIWKFTSLTERVRNLSGEILELAWALNRARQDINNLHDELSLLLREKDNDK
jgi:hypothetical protein